MIWFEFVASRIQIQIQSEVRIRILPSLSKSGKKNPDLYSLATTGITEAQHTDLAER